MGASYNNNDNNNNNNNNDDDDDNNNIKIYLTSKIYNSVVNKKKNANKIRVKRILV